MNEEHIQEQHCRYLATKPHKKKLKENRAFSYTLHRGKLHINSQKEQDQHHYPEARPILQHSIAELTEIASHTSYLNSIESELKRNGFQRRAYFAQPVGPKKKQLIPKY